MEDEHSELIESIIELVCAAESFTVGKETPARPLLFQVRRTIHRARLVHSYMEEKGFREDNAFAMEFKSELVISASRD